MFFTVGPSNFLGGIKVILFGSRIEWIELIRCVNCCSQ